MHVVADPFLEVGVWLSASSDLPESGESGSDGESAFAPCGAELIFVIGAGPWSDDAHVAAQDIKELREFIEVTSPEDSSDACDSWIVFDEELWSIALVSIFEQSALIFGVVVHGSELMAVEASSAARLSFVGEEERPSIFEPDGDHDDDKDGCADGERGDGERDVKDALASRPPLFSGGGCLHQLRHLRDGVPVERRNGDVHGVILQDRWFKDDIIGFDATSGADP